MISSRRIVLKAGLTLGLGLCAAPARAVTQGDAAAARPREGDLLIRAGDAGRTPLTPADIPIGQPQTLAWAFDATSDVVRNGSRLNQLMLLRFDPVSLSPETRTRSADGVVAYTTICTHNGCDVQEWLADSGSLYCACHESSFDPRDAARVVDGPAPRPLPALPLKVVDGKLVVAKPFTARVGFEPS
jgi:rieske iron-sulfur protein